MNQEFYRNITDYLVTVNRLTMDATTQVVKATQDFAMQAWKMHPMRDVFETYQNKK